MSDELGLIKFESGGTELHLKCNAMATLFYRGDTGLYLLSVAGPSSAIKAVAAAISSDAKAKYGAEHIPGVYGWRDIKRPKDTKFRCFKSKLGVCNIWHLLAVADTPGFIPNFTEEAFWQYLTSDQITTPILRSWVPYLRNRMDRHIVRLDSFGCEAVIIPDCQTAVDHFVSEGIATRQIEFPNGEREYANSLAV